MAVVYKTPGVYIEEISTLPPSVADVSTAIPAFIGYTEKGDTTAGPAISRINSLLEYEEKFGGAQPTKFSVSTSIDPLTKLEKVDQVTRADNGSKFLMYYSLSLYFSNGGGSCYIISVGNYDKTPAKADFTKGLQLLEKEDEPTLIVLTDAVNLANQDYYDLCKDALTQCHALGDRFLILDVLKATDPVKDFRDKIGLNYLMYGAAYYPYLQTSLTYQYTEDDVTIDGGTTKPEAKTKPEDKAKAEASTETAAQPEAPKTDQPDTKDNTAQKLTDIRSSKTALYNQIKTALASQRVILPPSAAVAGVYANVDRDRGVWKAPANVSLSNVIGPVYKITSNEQESLNVDPNAGKSINAIREFTGKGTLIWGARTLAGNDNEWRYVSVRRLFNMIEESTKKATSFAVFEPNDATTWLKVKGMIDSYLYGLWERGALAGPTPQAAYFVNVGLGKTMTAQDVLEGRMIVEIGVAAVRPAEFIIIRFSHKLQEA